MHAVCADMCGPLLVPIKLLAFTTRQLVLCAQTGGMWGTVNDREGCSSYQRYASTACELPTAAAVTSITAKGK